MAFCRRVGGVRLEHVQVRILWLQEAVADGPVEVRCTDTSLNTSDLGNKYLDAQKRAALLSMMLLTQFGGQGRAVGAVLEFLAGLRVAMENRDPMISDLVKSECGIDTVYVAWRQALTGRRTGAPWVLMVILIALTVLLGTAVLWLLTAKIPPGVQVVAPEEITKQVQGGHTSTDPASTGADTALAGGRDVEGNE